MASDHGDFVYMGILEQERPESEKASQKPRKAADIARDAAALAWRIRNTEPSPAKWKPLIDSADPELRECLRAYLKQAYREMQQRARRESEGGKKSPAADVAIAELAKRYGGAG